VQQRVASLTPDDFERAAPYPERDRIQRERLNLPPFPTTTIGSFPQTPEVRQMRQAYRTGKITAEEYDAYIQSQIRELIAFQEQIGLDVLVHGEFERTDMVEFFAEKMDGIAFTQQGWLLSYGTRAYRPPMIYGDVARTAPMTVKETAYAQSLTQKPVKGMLTGPVTIIAWSYVREDIPVEQVAYQIALAFRTRCATWSRQASRLCRSTSLPTARKHPSNAPTGTPTSAGQRRRSNSPPAPRPKRRFTPTCATRTSTPCCSISTGWTPMSSRLRRRAPKARSSARSNITTTRAKSDQAPFDVHTPAVPSVESIETVMTRAIRVFPKEQFWVNPDCGLKTRKWDEVIPALKHMVQAARNLRERQA